MQRFCGISNFMLAIDLIPLTLCFNFSRIEYFMKYKLGYISFGIVRYKIISVIFPNGLTFWNNWFMIWNQSLCD